MTPDLNSLQAFVEVAKARSFRQAAAGLQVSPSALSHSVARLEQALGVRLLHRSTRSVSPSAAGEILLARLAPALAQIGHALEAVHEQHGQLRGRVRLNVPRAAAQLVLAPRLAQWARQYPEVMLDIVSSDAVADIVELGFDAGMRFGALLQQDMVALPVGPPMRFVACASPDYLAAHGAPRTPAELDGHACLQLRFPSGALYRWEFLVDGEVRAVSTRGALALDDLPALLQAAVDGAGICYTYEALAAPHLAQGRLCAVLAPWALPAERFHLYYPSGRNMSASLRALVDFLK